MHINSTEQDALNWIEVGKAEDIPLAGARPVITPQGNIAVARAADGEIFAVADACPHRGASLSLGMVYGHRLCCAFHGLTVDLESGQAVAPDEGCVTRYPVKVVDGMVYLAAGAGMTSSCACAG